MGMSNHISQFRDRDRATPETPALRRRLFGKVRHRISTLVHLFFARCSALHKARPSESWSKRINVHKRVGLAIYLFQVLACRAEGWGPDTWGSVCGGHAISDEALAERLEISKWRLRLWRSRLCKEGLVERRQVQEGGLAYYLAPMRRFETFADMLVAPFDFEVEEKQASLDALDEAAKDASAKKKPIQ
jgi:hypothetical protein